MMRSFYEILGVSRKCSQEEIISAYRRKVIETHPDKGGDAILFQNVRKAYEILSNPDLRKKYNIWLDEKEKYEKENIEKREEKNSTIKNNEVNKSTTSQNAESRKLPYTYIFFYTIVSFVTIILLYNGFHNYNKYTSTYSNDKDDNYQIIKSEIDSTTVFEVEDITKKESAIVYQNRKQNKRISKDENRKWLYDALVKNGYELGSYESYNSLLEYEVERRWLYETAKEKGIDTGTFEEFNKALGFTDRTYKTNKDNNSSNYTRHEIKESYKEVKFSTGDRPYVSYYGKGKYDTSSLSKITFINYSQTDAVVLLVEDGYVIRNNFISRGDSFTMNFIPKGEYTIRVMFGNSWNPNKDNGSGYPKGGFMKNISFMKSKDYETFNCWPEETYDGINYPTYSVTLHKVSNGNMNTEKINKSEFFN